MYHWLQTTTRWSICLHHKEKLLEHHSPLWKCIAFTGTSARKRGNDCYLLPCELFSGWQHMVLKQQLSINLISKDGTICKYWHTKRITVCVIVYYCCTDNTLPLTLTASDIWRGSHFSLLFLVCLVPVSLQYMCHSWKTGWWSKSSLSVV